MWGSVAAMVGSQLIGGVMQSGAASDAADTQAAAGDRATAEQRRQYDTTRADLQPYRDAGGTALQALLTRLGLGNPNASSAAAAGIKKPTLADAQAEQLAWHQAKYGSGYTAGSDMAANDQQTQARYDRMMGEYNAQIAALPQDTATAAPDPQFGDLLRKFTMDDFQNDPVTKASFDFGMSEGEKAVQRMFGSRGMSRSGAAVKAATRFATDYTGTKAGESYNRFTADQGNVFNKLAAVSGIGQTATNTTAQAGQTATNAISDITVGTGNARGAASIASGNAYGNAASNISNQISSQYTLDKILNRAPSVPTYNMGDYSIGAVP